MTLSLLVLASVAATLESVGDHYFAAGNYQMARAVYEQALGQDQSEELREKLGRADYYLGDYAAAIRQLESVRFRRPATYFYLGLCYLFAGRFEEALTALTQARHCEYPDCRRPAYYQAIALVFLHRFAEARTILAGLTEFAERDWWLGYVLAREGDDLDSGTWLTSALKKPGWWQADAAYLLATRQDLPDSSLLQFDDTRLKLLQARQYLVQGDWERARRIYSGLTGYEPYRLLGEGYVLEQTDSLTRALEHYDHVVTLSGEPGLHEIAFRRSAFVELRRSNVTAAKTDFLKYLELHKGIDEPVFFELGNIYFDRGAYDSALIFYNPLNDSTDEYLFARGRTHYRLNDNAIAITTLEQHHRLFPDSPTAQRVLVILGNLHAKTNDPRAAREYWQALIDFHPGSQYRAFAQMQIAASYVRQNEFTKALEAYRNVEHLNPTQALLDDARLAVEEMKFRLGKHPSQADALRAFAAKYPASPKAAAVQLRLADQLIETGAVDQATQLLERLADQDSTAGDAALLMLARAYRKQADTGGDTSVSRREKNSYYKLLARFPQSPNRPVARLELASIYLEEQSYDSSLQHFGELLENREYRPKALLEIGRIYRMLKKYDEAELVLKRLTDDPASTEFSVPALVELAMVLKEQGRYDEAIKIVKSLEEKNSDLGPALLLKGDILSLARDYQGARAAYLRAAEQFSEERDRAAQALLRTGEMNLLLDEPEEARESLTRALFLVQDERLKMEIMKKLAQVEERGKR